MRLAPLDFELEQRALSDIRTGGKLPSVQVKHSPRAATLR
jgi:hypothetical protein